MSTAPITLQNLHNRLRALLDDGAPQVAALAGWLIERPQEIAFKSVRALATDAGVNSNTVVRLAKALGFDGYDACRAAFQDAMRGGTLAYSARAAALLDTSDSDVMSALRQATQANTDAIFSTDMVGIAAKCATELLAARRAHCVGVRSCYSVAHYFAYIGNIAFPNFVQTPAQPGTILDQISDTGPEDIVIAITYAHYSTEVIRATQIARDCGARVIALTDSLASPIAQDAWQTIPLPMSGPQLMPSLTTAFLAVEFIIAEMAARSPEAQKRMQRYEYRISEHGGYAAGSGR
ncbi:MAG: MurR/RpiR family transcriptional regulator [Rhodobacteraceae bacterium]|nr:MurR/RpiR family transcriptional regulator [Paracoccaceae bacterium]